MKTMIPPTVVLGALLAISCSLSSRGPAATPYPGPLQSVATATAPAEKSTADGMRITLALPDSIFNPEFPSTAGIKHRHSTHLLVGKANHFNVVLTNVSDHDIHWIEENNSWGDVALHFEFIDEHGKAYIIEKKPAIWLDNGSTYWTLHPGDPVVIEVCFGGERQGGPVWTGLPDLKSNSVYGTLTAIFDFDTAEFDFPRPVKLWTGHIRSEAIPCSLTASPR